MSKRDGMLKAACNRVVGMHHELPCTYNKLEVDPAADFGTKVLHVLKDGEVEVVLNSATLMGAEVGLMKRYPGPAMSEFSKVRFVSPEEAADRCWAFIEDAEQARLAAEAILSQAEAGIILIPCEKGLLNKHGGADFDGDGMKTIIGVGKGKEAYDLAARTTDFATVLE